MKVVRESRLARDGGRQLYEVALVELDGSGPARFGVLSRAGRAGTALPEQRRTPDLLTRAEAQRVFDSIVVAQLNRGYDLVRAEAGGTVGAPPRSAHDPARAGALILDRLAQRRLTGRRRRRLIWRAGELGLADAESPLLALLDTLSDPLDRYVTCWALGRLGGAAATARLAERATADPVEMVRRIARLGAFRLTPAAERPAALETERAALPEPVRRALGSGTGGGGGGEALFRAWLTGRDNEPGEAAVGCFLLAQGEEAVRALLLDALALMPLRGRFLRPLRYIAKAAELFDDGEILARIGRRVGADDLPVAPPPGTFGRGVRDRFTLRDWWRRRLWRTLRRAATWGPLERFRALALPVLLEARADDAQAPERLEIPGRPTLWLPPLRRPFLAGLLVHGGLGRVILAPGGRVALASAPPAAPDGGAAPRQDAFPEVWDRLPEDLLRLALEAAAPPVRAMAVRALSDNRPWLGALPLERVLALLGGADAAVAGLGVTLAIDLWRREGTDRLALLAALTRLDLPEAETFIRAELPTGAAAPRPAAWALVATAALPGLRVWARLALIEARLEPEEQDDLAARLLAWLIALPAPEEGTGAVGPDPAATVADLAWLFDHPLAGVLPGRTAALAEATAAAHPAVRALAARLLAAHAPDPAALPETLLAQLIGSDEPPLIEAGVTLLGRLPDARLLGRVPLLARLATMPAARAALAPVLARLAPAHPAFAVELLAETVTLLLDPDLAEDRAAGAADLLAAHVLPVLPAPEPGLVLRLGGGGRAGGELVAAALLARLPAEALPVDALAGFAVAATARLRRAALAALALAPARVAAAADRLMARLFDSPWEDGRAEAVRLIDAALAPGDWTEARLLLVLDSDHADIQAFGGALMRRGLASLQGGADAARLMSRLAEHPSPALSGSLVALMEEVLPAEPARLEALLPACRTLMLRVNGPAAPRRRLAALLARLGLAQATSAAVLAPLFHELSASRTPWERAAALSTLVAWGAAWPELALPLRPLPPPLRATA